MRGSNAILSAAAFPVRMTLSLWEKKELIRHFIWREFLGRYRGAHLGVLLSLASPLILLTVYTLVFGVVFKGSFGSGDGKAPFALALFSGLIFFQLFADSVGRAAPLLASNPNFITKVVFPLEILPIAVVGSAVLHFFVSLAILLLGILLLTHTLPWTVLLLPLLLVPITLLALGATWLLAAAGLYFRDLGAIVPSALMALTFLSAIFYPVTAVPERFQWVMLANPMACFSEMARAIFIFGQWPHWAMWSYASFVSFALALFGYFVFMRLKRGFSDAI